MVRIVTPAALALSLVLAGPALAQDSQPAPRNPDLSEGLGLLEQGTRLMLRGLMEELGPALREMEEGLGALQEMLGDMTLYHAPEVLPNGDILIRRRTPLEPGAPEPEPGAEIEL